MTEITNTASIVTSTTTTTAPARLSADVATAFNAEMQAQDGADDAQDLDGQNIVDDNDQDLYQGLGDSANKGNNRRRKDDALRDPRFQYYALADTTDPNEAGIMLRISLAQHGLLRDNFLSHANYVNKLGGDAAADYFNAVTGTHCSELGLYAIGFAYTDWPTFCLDDDSDLKILEYALSDRRLNANDEILHGRGLPVLENFSDALALASHSNSWLDATSDDLTDGIAALEFGSAQEVAAMRLFDTGSFSSRLLSPLIDETVQRLPQSLAPHDVRFSSLNTLMDAACATVTTAIEIMANDQLTDGSIDRLAALQSQSTDRFLETIYNRNNVGIDPAATRLHLKIEDRLEHLPPRAEPARARAEPARASAELARAEKSEDF